MLGDIKLKKYKSILTSILFFIVLDVSVLAFNYYISCLISRNAVEINLAGQQRTLTQRITKSFLELERSYHKSRDYSLIVTDIEESMRLFDDTLKAFDKGGKAIIDKRIVSVEAIVDSRGRAAIEAAKPIWSVYKNYAADVVVEFKGRESIDEGLVTIFFRESILKDVVIYAARNNVYLLDEMNRLTKSVESVAAKEVAKLRFAQTLAIFFAVVNFFFILFFSVSKLRNIDSELDFVNTELDVMLNTIEEGLFLLNSELVVSGQYSKKMDQIFNQGFFSGQSFISLLRSVCHDFNEEGVKDFLLALFDESKNSKVLNALNPLKVVLVHIKSSNGNSEDKKYLRFICSRVKTGAGIERLLIRVSDISSEVLKERMAAEERSKQFKQLRLMSALMSSNADMLPIFFQRSFSCFDNINGVLKAPSSTFEDLLAKVNRIDYFLNEFQLEAKQLSLESLLEVAGDLQAELDKLKAKTILLESDFVDISFVLDHLVSHTESIYQFSNKILAESSVKAARSDIVLLSDEVKWAHLNEFADAIAGKEGKQVEVVTSGLNDYLLPKEMLSYLNSILLQLICHSITISLENVIQRVRHHKSPSGVIDIRFVKKKSGGYYLTVRNDGVGLDVNEMRAAAVGGGAICDTPSESMTKPQLLSLLFYSCDSEATPPIPYGGDLVFGSEIMDFIRRSDVRFDIRSVDGEGSVFEFMFPHFD